MARTGKSIIKRKVTSRYTIHLKLADSILHNICSEELHQADMSVWVKEKSLRHVLGLLESDGRIVWQDKNNEVVSATISGYKFNAANGYYGEIRIALIDRLIRQSTLIIALMAGVAGLFYGLYQAIKIFYCCFCC